MRLNVSWRCGRSFMLYWIIDPVAEKVELFRLAGDTYPPVAALSEGPLSSAVVPGFEIPVLAIFNEAENARVMRQMWAGA